MSYPPTDEAIRSDLLSKIETMLPRLIQGSSFVLRGSLSTGKADALSDIDGKWIIPDHAFGDIDTCISKLIECIHPVASIRSDPDFQHSSGRRLFFIQFKNVSLFYRFDLDVFADFTGGDTNFDLHNAKAGGEQWDVGHSALMNVVAALRAVYRKKNRVAIALIERAEQNVGIDTQIASFTQRSINLVSLVRNAEPGLLSVCDEIMSMVQDMQAISDQM